MTLLVAALMIVALAALVAYPFLAQGERTQAGESRDARELLRREKDVALMAIREADLDRAMGKLSDEDYSTLRAQYESRALGALTALDDLASRIGVEVERSRGDEAAAPTGTARFCVKCGRQFQQAERFCPACGRART